MEENRNIESYGERRRERERERERLNSIICWIIFQCLNCLMLL